MCVKEIFAKGTVQTVKAYNRFGSSVVEHPSEKTVASMLGSWPFLLVAYENGLVDKVTITVGEQGLSFKCEPHKSFLAG